MQKVLSDFLLLLRLSEAINEESCVVVLPETINDSLKSVIINGDKHGSRQVSESWSPSGLPTSVLVFFLHIPVYLSGPGKPKMLPTNGESHSD